MDIDQPLDNLAKKFLKAKTSQKKPAARTGGAGKTGLVVKKKLAGSKTPRFAVGGSAKRGAKISQSISVARTKGGVSKIARRNQPSAKAKQALPEPAPYTRPAVLPEVWKHDLYKGPAVRRQQQVHTPGGDLRKTVLSKSTMDTTTPAVRRVAPAPEGQLIISNLAASVTQEDMKDLFGAEGEVVRVSVRGGSATVIFKTIAEADSALAKYNGVTLDGKPMRIVKGRNAVVEAARAAAAARQAF